MGNGRGSVNETIEKFGYPSTLLKEYKNWVVLLRPEQVTLGSMVLACKSDATAMSQLDAGIFGELSEVVGDLEGTLQKTFHHDKINYLLLMMVDKNVHFHVLPRYAEARTFSGGEFQDTSWPGPPNLATSIDLSDAQRSALLDHFRSNWGR
jgi:diadenosine tetraphosphate (Ap4A) HIT family hydrolase